MGVFFFSGKVIDTLVFYLGGSVSLVVDLACMVIADMELLDLSGSVLYMVRIVGYFHISMKT